MKNKIGLFGFGCVGQGLYDILIKNRHFNAEIMKICVKHQGKKRPLPEERFTYEKDDILEDQDINLIVELINDADDAFNIVSTALKKGKRVITANKKMVAHNFMKLYELQRQYGGVLLYEAACCGSIPIIRNLEEYFDNEPLNAVYGIFNGSSNYILSKVNNDNFTYQQALKQAQDLGFAELDPTLDVGGFDATNKLSIITSHAFGITIPPKDIFTFGIQHFNSIDLDISHKNDLKIKSLALAKLHDDQTVTNLVIPVFVQKNDDLYDIEDEFNAVIVNGKFSGIQLFKGKGAGGHPTGSAVLSDISASQYDYRYEYKKIKYKDDYTYRDDLLLSIYLRTEDSELVEKLQWEKINQKVEIDNRFLVSGDINLQELIKHQDRLNNNAFIAAYNIVPEYPVNLVIPVQKAAIETA